MSPIYGSKYHRDKKLGKPPDSHLFKLEAVVGCEKLSEDVSWKRPEYSG